jgi:uncharacterized protein YpuA (DUF1002 family)
MSPRLPPSVMKANVDAAIARDRNADFRKSLMARLREKANQLHAVMANVADNDVDFTKVYGSVIRDEAAWDQLMLDLEALAGLARMEE